MLQNNHSDRKTLKIPKLQNRTNSNYFITIWPNFCLCSLHRKCGWYWWLRSVWDTLIGSSVLLAAFYLSSCFPNSLHWRFPKKTLGEDSWIMSSHIDMRTWFSWSQISVTKLISAIFHFLFKIFSRIFFQFLKIKWIRNQLILYCKFLVEKLHNDPKNLLS